MTNFGDKARLPFGHQNSSDHPVNKNYHEDTPSCSLGVLWRGIFPMNRYMLGALLGLISLLTAYGIGNSQDFVRQIPRASRNAVSSAPTAAAEAELTGVAAAGQNVTRQTSEQGLQQSRQAPAAVSQTTAADGAEAQIEMVGEAEFPEQNLDNVQPVAPANPEPVNQDAIPALW